MNNLKDLLLPGERVDDLQFMDLRIIQSPDAFRFGMDAVLLADFARPRPRSRVCDLGTGTGILPLLLYGRDSTITCDAVEIQPDAAERAQRTMRLNGLESRIKIFNRDLKEIRSFLPHASYELVICNPPYSPSAASLPSPKAHLQSALQPQRRVPAKPQGRTARGTPGKQMHSGGCRCCCRVAVARPGALLPDAARAAADGGV